MFIEISDWKSSKTWPVQSKINIDTKFKKMKDKEKGAGMLKKARFERNPEHKVMSDWEFFFIDIKNIFNSLLILLN